MKIVFDIDGTLADCGHRLHYIHRGQKNWDAFFKACDDDTPISAGVNLLRALIFTDMHTIELWTGRPERSREATMNWLRAHAGVSRWDYTLRMRADGDHRPDTVVKLEFFDACGFMPDIIFDDRTSVVEAYRARGLTVYQVAPGNY